ncbi:MAG: PspC domain-containing protein [Acidobacteriales bacterium]|nr:PspC domain-containing protein [Candidatus Koribacter versatilis]MBI3645413.1 PspC domain-containing protein [Terriglobales bacterium]
MYCNACGKAIAEDARFCTYCGTVVGHPPAPKKLIRSRTDRKIAGVCAGMGRYLDLDVTLVRLVWALVTLMAGVLPGVVVYVLAWIVIPEEPEVRPVVAPVHPVTNP